MKQRRVDLVGLDGPCGDLRRSAMASKSLGEWVEITGLDFTLYGEEFTEATVGFVAALRFHNISDQSILESVERRHSPSSLLREDISVIDAGFPENQWTKSQAWILAVANLPAVELLAIYRSVETMIHSKLCRQAGLQE
jgi:hypothetical protein